MREMNAVVASPTGHEVKRKLLTVLAVVLLAGPMAASAELVTWEVRGTITVVSGPIFGFNDVAVGEEFSTLLTFDSEAALLRTRSGGVFDPGVRYEYDPSSTVMSVRIGARAPVFFSSLGTTKPSGTAIDFLWARNDSGDQANNGEPVSDGYSWVLGGQPVVCGSSTDYPKVQIIFRGPELDLVTDAQLPTQPDPRLASLPISVLQLVGDNSCDNQGSIVGVGGITSVQVKPASPEELLSGLITGVVNLNLRSGIGDALDSKLQNAFDALDRAQAGDTASAAGILYAFIQSVEAQRGKKLTDAQADQLVASAQAVIDALSR